jgi:hypothetical protein
MTDAPKAGVENKHKCLNKVTDGVIPLNDSACHCLSYRVQWTNWNASWLEVVEVSCICPGPFAMWLLCLGAIWFRKLYIRIGRWCAGGCGMVVWAGVQGIICRWCTPPCVSVLLLSECVLWFFLTAAMSSLVSILERVPVACASYKWSVPGVLVCVAYVFSFLWFIIF